MALAASICSYNGELADDWLMVIASSQSV